MSSPTTEVLARLWPMIEADIERIRDLDRPPLSAPPPLRVPTRAEWLAALEPGAKLTIFSAGYPSGWIKAASRLRYGHWTAVKVGIDEWSVTRVY